MQSVKHNDMTFCSSSQLAWSIGVAVGRSWTGWTLAAVSCGTMSLLFTITITIDTNHCSITLQDTAIVLDVKFTVNSFPW